MSDSLLHEQHWHECVSARQMPLGPVLARAGGIRARLFACAMHCLSTLPPSGQRLSDKCLTAHGMHQTAVPRLSPSCMLLKDLSYVAGTGKTTWAQGHLARNPDKRYMLLGTNAVMEQMRVCLVASPSISDPCPESLLCIDVRLLQSTAVPSACSPHLSDAMVSDWLCPGIAI